MAVLLHIDPDILNLTARLLSREQILLAEKIRRLRQRVGYLEMSWHGDDAEDFFDAMRRLLLELRQCEQELQKLAQLLTRQADLWLESDQRWAQIYQELHTSRRQE